MADLQEEAAWVDGIYQLETTDPVVGGAPNLQTGQGMSNVQAQQLAKRTGWLREALGGSIADLNEIARTGAFSFADDAAGAPGSQAGMVVHVEKDASTAIQTATDVNGATFTRVRSDNAPTWSAWVQVWQDEFARDEVRSLVGQEYGLGSGAIEVADLDLIEGTGFFDHGGDTPNAPEQDSDGKILQIESPDGERAQLVFTSTTKVYFRDRDTVGGSWGGWRKIWSDAEASALFDKNGYQVLPSGMIIQWGTSSGTSDTPFPTSFPNDCLFATGSDNNDNGPDPVGVGYTKDYITFDTDDSGSVRWLAIGH